MTVTEITENMVFRLSSQRSPQQVKLLHLEWAVVTQLDGEKTVGEISDILALSKTEMKDIFKNLLKEGLLELVSVSPDNLYLQPGLFVEIEYELTTLMGPVASVLIEEVLQSMRKSRDQFEKNALASLIDLLSSHINDAEKQIEFQRNIYPKIKPYIVKL
ncbi:MAG: hypothetical protein P8184_00460 [Calditrichia bacterium]